MLIVIGLLMLLVVFVALSYSPWWMGVDDGICHSCEQIKGRGYCNACLEETE